MAFKRPRIFLDTSTLISGIASDKGAARRILQIAELGLVQITISNQVIIEADRNFESKLPSLVYDFREYIKNLAPFVCKDPSPMEIEYARKIINIKDASILAAAIKADVEYLVTHDRKGFKIKQLQKEVKFSICTPSEFLAEFKEMTSP